MSNAHSIQKISPAGHRALMPQLLSKLYRFSNLLFLADTSAKDQRKQSAIRELRSAGLSAFQLDRRESRHIAAYLNPGEHIRAGIRGHIYGVGGVLLVATDARILYLHDIPLFSNFEEFPYEVVSGVSINRAGYLSSIAVFTKFKTYQVDYVSPRQAERFLSFVETQIYYPKPHDFAGAGKEPVMR